MKAVTAMQAATEQATRAVPPPYFWMILAPILAGVLVSLATRMLDPTPNLAREKEIGALQADVDTLKSRAERIENKIDSLMERIK